MKTILITGISRGIGKALAKKFLDNGDFVMGTSTKGTVDFSHENLNVFTLDLSNSESIKKCVESILNTKNGIDVLVNNAGIAIEEEFNHKTIVIDFLRKILEVNVIGTADFTEQIIPLIHSGGQIINISSRAGSLEFNGYNLNYPGYRISKTALNMMTKILASRLQNKIKVSSVHPGWVQTDMGGAEADVSPEEAARDIFTLVNSDVETGQFWFKQNKFPW